MNQGSQTDRDFPTGGTPRLRLQTARRLPHSTSASPGARRNAGRSEVGRHHHAQRRGGRERGSHGGRGSAQGIIERRLAFDRLRARSPAPQRPFSASRPPPSPSTGPHSSHDLSAGYRHVGERGHRLETDQPPCLPAILAECTHDPGATSCLQPHASVTYMSVRRWNRAQCLTWEDRFRPGSRRCSSDSCQPHGSETWRCASDRRTPFRRVNHRCSSATSRRHDWGTPHHMEEGSWRAVRQC
ncbi:hypothetical protein CYFUS_009035 [Cystobacter fuscus]|uniref:Uncharacterized protein n=1 Tax=Cystobacter fuscus TaxID=43 RepID=A0A250JI41_9BACT|nr:hypothetical protein CYFUS_009035 [Cystobacter fuscus]